MSFNKPMIFFLLLVISVFGCSANRNDEDTDSAPQRSLQDTATISIQGSDSASESAEDVRIDTADGLGGVDEACYSFDRNGTVLMWCDTPELIMQQCDDFAGGCCCRAACAPSMCDGADETLPCIVFDAENMLGYCDYPVDNVPVAYECLDTCTPRSDCLTVDSDGSCLDTDASASGVCLVGGIDTDAAAYCQPSCQVARCDEQHYCSPLTVGSTYDGSGACLPILTGQ